MWVEKGGVAVLVWIGFYADKVLKNTIETNQNTDKTPKTSVLYCFLTIRVIFSLKVAIG